MMVNCSRFAAAAAAAARMCEKQ